MLFSRDKNESEKPKQSMTGFLLKPDIGGSIRPIGESIGMFVRLIAMIFASSGLFPKNHPALTGALPMNDPNARLTLMQVVATGWNSFSFTKEDLPKALMFFAFVGTMGIGVVILFMFLMSLMTSTAHAQSMFVPPSEENDLAHKWLAYLFKEQPIQGLLVRDSSGNLIEQITQSVEVQRALKAGLALYSTAVLVVAGIVLLYHLTHMVAETAHTGKVMGNANQIWAPIRLVFAIGLLVPISGGLNTGQYIMVQMADWGSGLASNVWKLFVTELAEKNNGYVAPSKAQVSSIVYDMALVLACERAYNHYAGQIQGVWTDIPLMTQNVMRRQTTTERPNYNELSFDYGTSEGGNNAICGGYSYDIPNNAGSAQSYDRSIGNFVVRIYTQRVTAFESARGASLQNLANNIDYFYEENQNATVPSNDAYQKTVQEFSNAINNIQVTQGELNMDRMAQAWADFGWVAAGAWFNNIARTQGIVSNVGNDSLPRTKTPVLIRDQQDAGQVDYIEGRTAIALDKYKNWLSTGGGGQQNAINSNTMRQYHLDALAGRSYDVSDANFFTGVMKIVQFLGQSTGLFDENGNLIFTHIGSSANPFAELTAKGHQALKTSFDLVGLAVMVAAGEELGNTIKAWRNNRTSKANLKSDAASFFKQDTPIWNILSRGGKALVGPIILISALLFTVGLLLAFILPLLPFTLFFFNTLSWVVSVFEAVVSMPLLALAHLTTKGDGIHGDMARAGYFMIFSVFLRPVLMVFGLIAGILIFFISISLLNMCFEIAARGTGSWAETGAGAIFSRLVFSAIYAVMAYIAANSSFKTISFFPDHAMRWIGQQGVQTERMGDKQLMSGAVQAITAYGFTQSLSPFIQQSGAGAAAIAGIGKMGGQPRVGTGLGNNSQQLPGHTGLITGGTALSGSSTQKENDQNNPNIQQGGQSSTSIPVGSSSRSKSFPVQNKQDESIPAQGPIQRNIPRQDIPQQVADKREPDHSVNKGDSPNHPGRPAGKE